MHKLLLQNSNAGKNVQKSNLSDFRTLVVGICKFDLTCRVSQYIIPGIVTNTSHNYYIV